MINAVRDILETRVSVLEKHIKDDKAWLNDNFLGFFMKGRVFIEEMWLDEDKRLLESKKLTPDSMINVLEERRAIVKTFITEERNRFNTTDGQEMRGRCVINGHWLEETEKLIKILEQVRG